MFYFSESRVRWQKDATGKIVPKDAWPNVRFYCLETKSLPVISLWAVCHKSDAAMLPWVGPFWCSDDVKSMCWMFFWPPKIILSPVFPPRHAMFIHGQTEDEELEGDLRELDAISVESVETKAWQSLVKMQHQGRDPWGSMWIHGDPCGHVRTGRVWRLMKNGNGCWIQLVISCHSVLRSTDQMPVLMQ